MTTIYRIPADDIPTQSITDKCIVLDLDQTLIATQEDIESLKRLGIYSNPKLLTLRNRTYDILVEDLEKPGIGTVQHLWGVTRPHLFEFLLFCFKYFKIVVVCTAGKYLYALAIVAHIFKDLSEPHYTFAHEDIYIYFGPKGEPRKPLVKLSKSHSLLQTHMSLENTFALDDNPLTFTENPDNGILIPAYEPYLNINDPNRSIKALSQEDVALLQLKYWLLQPEVINAKDVRTLNTRTIFTTPLSTYKSTS